MSTLRKLIGSANIAFAFALFTAVIILIFWSPEAQAKRVPYAVREAQRAAAASILAEQVLEQHLISASGVCSRLGMSTGSDEAEIEKRASIRYRPDRRRNDRYRAPTFGYRDGADYNLETSGSRRVRCKSF